jgi:hypothetical protein
MIFLSPQLKWIIGIYLWGVLVTFGHMFRMHERVLQLRQLFGALGWPVYWVVYYGVARTVETAVHAIEPIGAFFRQFIVGDTAIALYMVGAYIFPAFYIATNWTSCSAPYCADLAIVAVKGVLWALWWPVYLWLYVAPGSH